MLAPSADVAAGLTAGSLSGTALPPGTSSPNIASPPEAHHLGLLVLNWDSSEGPPRLQSPHGTSRATAPFQLFPLREDLPTNLMVLTCFAGTRPRTRQNFWSGALEN